MLVAGNVSVGRGEAAFTRYPALKILVLVGCFAPTARQNWWFQMPVLRWVGDNSVPSFTCFVTPTHPTRWVWQDFCKFVIASEAWRSTLSCQPEKIEIAAPPLCMSKQLGVKSQDFAMSKACHRDWVLHPKQQSSLRTKLVIQYACTAVVTVFVGYR